MTPTARLLFCLLVAGAASSLSASLVLVSPVEMNGTGLGAVNTVLTVASPSNGTIETGCVAPSGAGTITSGCGFADSSVQAQVGTPTLAAVGIATAADLRIVFNASEPGNARDITLNSLVLTLYSGANTFSAGLSPAAGIFFPTTEAGTGNSGFMFALASPVLCAAIGGCPAGTDTGEAAAAQTFIAANGGAGSVRVGLGASVGAAAGGTGSSTGGLETFFVGSANTIGVPFQSEVPEPAAIMFVGLGLIGIACAQRRRQRVR
jgi:PEP-CTERM motif